MNNNQPGKKSKSARRRARAQKRAQSITNTINNNPPPVPSKKRRNRGRKGRGSSVKFAYAKTLMDPCRYIGMKIPDAVSWSTGTFQLSMMGSLSTAAGGDSVLLDFAPGLYNAVFTANGAATGALNINQHAVSFAQANSIVGLYSQVRVVSACLDMEFIGPSTADGGFWDAALVSRGEPITVSVSDFETNYPNVMTSSLHSRNVRVIYKPQDNEDLDFTITAPNNVRSNVGRMVVVATGLPSGVAYIRYRATANFEGIPGAGNSTIVSSSPSPIDFDALESSLNSVRSQPSVYWDTVASYLPSSEDLINAANVGMNIYRATQSQSSNRYRLDWD